MELRVSIGVLLKVLAGIVDIEYPNVDIEYPRGAPDRQEGSQAGEGPIGNRTGNRRRRETVRKLSLGKLGLALGFGPPGLGPGVRDPKSRGFRIWDQA